MEIHIHTKDNVISLLREEDDRVFISLEDNDAADGEPRMEISAAKARQLINSLMTIFGSELDADDDIQVKED